MKLSYDTLMKKYSVALKQIQMLEKLNKQMFTEKHKSEERIMELESELRALRDCYFEE